MKAVVQRVLSASVAVDGQIVSSIGKGMLVLVGLERDDTPADSALLVKKLLSIKLFDAASQPELSAAATGADTPSAGAERAQEGGSGERKERNVMWKRDIRDIQGDILCVSQFTLFANFKKGAKPDFHESMSTVPGKELYGSFLDDLRRAYDGGRERVKDGVFGAMMQVSLVNDGPVTILLDTKESPNGKKSKSGSSTPNPAINGNESTNTVKPKVGAKQKQKQPDQADGLENGLAKVVLGS